MKKWRIKNWRIRTKLALWYTTATVLMLGIFFVAAAVTLTPAILSGGRRTIEREAKDVAEVLELSSTSGLRFSEDPEVRSNTYYSVWTTEGELVMNNHEFEWLNTLNNSAGSILHITHEDEDWLVYDRFAHDNERNIARLRAAMTVTSVEEATEMLLRLLLFILPVALTCSILIGWLIASRALRPVDDVTKTALEISRGDLSRRLNLPETKDEIGRMVATLDEMLASLDAAFQREKQFTSDASHELRTPLSIIIAYAEEALGNPNATNEQYKESLADIYQKGRDMQALLAQMLLLARMFENTQAMEIVDINLGEIIADIADENNLTAAQKDISIETDIAPEIFVRGDLLLMTRLIINLIDNAIHYGRQGGWIRLSVTKENDKAVLTVADNGIGISPESLPHIFERFYRADAARSSGSGSGLGLALVKQIVKLHGGNITVKSSVAEGTTFRVVI